MTDIKQICANLIELWDADCDIDLEINVLRATLAKPEPEGPTDAELMEIFADHDNGLEEIWPEDWPAAARDVLARWGGSRR